MENSVHLPAGHKFTMYLDKDGNYVLESQQERGLVIHGPTPDLVVMEMTEILPMWESFKVWAGNIYREPDFSEHAMKAFENFQEMTWDSESDTLAWKLKKAYSDPVFCREALKLNKEFEGAEMEVLNRLEP